MEVLLLTDIPGIGRRNDVLVVGNGYALNFLLPNRKALVVTPSVRKRYAEHIKQRALERESEKSLHGSTLDALKGKIVTVSRKATKTGKLYAAVSEKMIVDALGTQHSVAVNEQHVKIEKPIKSTGKHVVVVHLGDQSMSVTVEITADEKAKE